MPNSYNSSHTGEWQDDLFNLIYPIGSIYLSVNATSPATLFGGTWEQIEDSFLLSAGSTYAAGTTGGAASATSDSPSNDTSGSTVLTENQIPSHRHLRLYADSGTWATSPLYGVYLYNTSPQTGNLLPNSTNWSATNANMQHTAAIRTGATGGGAGHTHTLSSHTHTVSTMPPYLTVYMWKRTA